MEGQAGGTCGEVMLGWEGLGDLGESFLALVPWAGTGEGGGEKREEERKEVSGAREKGGEKERMKEGEERGKGKRVGWREKGA